MRLRLAYDPTRNVCLSGSTGYVGASLLNSGFYDFGPIEALEELPTRCVLIHLAAATAGNDRQTLLDNLAMDSYVADWADSTTARVVYASGNNVYGKALDCRTEDSTHLQDYYSASKIFGEILLRERLGERCCILRIGDVFGVGQRHGALFRAIESAIGKKEALVQIGDGLKLRSYIYITELVRQIAHAASLLGESNGSGTYNIGHADPITVRELLARLSELTGLPLDMSRARPDASNMDVRTMRIQSLPGYDAEFTMDTALRDYVSQLKGKK